VSALAGHLGIGFRTSPQNVEWPMLEEAWAEAGRHEVFESGWMNDHLSDPRLDTGGPSFEAMTALAALSHHVPGRTLGHTVLSATFRQPGVLAKEALTLDHVTGGRFVLGLGAGWHEGEHRTLGIELPAIGERMGRLESTVEVLRALFSEEAAAGRGVSLDAPPYRLASATMEPAPVRAGGPAIWLGGQKPRGMRLAARLGDGWNYPANRDGTPEEFDQRREALWRACDEVGRDRATLTISTQLHVGEEAADRAAVLDQAIRFAQAGAQVILFTIAGQTGAAGIRALAHDVCIPLRERFG